MQRKVLFTALFALLVSGAAGASTATYRLTISNNWIESNYPAGYPEEAHFSWFGGGTHAAPESFWQLGGTATPGFEILAESGETTPWVEELEAAGASGLEWQHWFCTPVQTHENCGPLSVTFEVRSDKPFLSLASMLGPSPDWFVGVSDLELREQDSWKASLSVPLVLYDAGTETGTTPTIENPSNSETIKLLTYEATTGSYLPSTTPLTLGQMTLELIGITNPPILLSTTAAGTGGDGTSWDPSLSADAQIVAFSSDATDLDTANANGPIRDIFVLNRATGERINLTDGGNGTSEDPVLSADGQWLAFRTRASNLPTDVPDTNGPVADIVLANLLTQELTLVTAGANGDSSIPSISGDGRRLAFDTLATNLAAGNYQPFQCSPTDTSREPCYKNILVYDRVSEFTLNLTQGGMSDSRAPAISEAGSHVAYNSSAFAPRSSLVVMNIDTGERRQVGNPPLTINTSTPYLSANARWVTVLHAPPSGRTVAQPSVYLYDLENDQEYRLDNASRLTGDFSSDERYLFLSSVSTRLDLPDPNGNGRDIYRLDLSTAPWGDTGPPLESFERVTSGGNQGSGGPSTNHDGSIFVWDSTASNFAADNNGDNFDVFLLDLNGASGGQVNRSPTANAQNLTTNSGESIDIVLQGFDPDGDTLSFQIVADPANGTLNGTPPQLTYTPNEGYRGNDSFTFRVNDSSNTSQPATVNIAVASINNPPTGTDNTEFTTFEDTQLAITLTGSDIDNDPLIFLVTSQPVNGSLSGSAPDLAYSPAANFNGEDTLSFTVSDGEFTSDPVSVNITILPVNDAPVAVPQSLTTDANASLSITLGGNDVDSQTLTFALVGLPANGSVLGSLPNLLYTPAANFVGSDSFTFNVSDGTSRSIEARVSIEVIGAVGPTDPTTPTNSAPIASPQSLLTPSGNALAIVLAGSDADNDELTFNLATLPANGSLSGQAPALVYTPDPGYTGQDRFSFSVSDAETSSELVTVSIKVIDTAVTLFSAVLPASRSVEVGTTATVFATLINAGSTNALECSLHLPDATAADFFYQTTDSATNAITGQRNQSVNVAAGSSQSFLLGITPNEVMPPNEVALEFRCANASDAASIVGLNTLLLSASLESAPDLIALAATATNNGVMEMANNNGFFTVATINVGSTAQISVSADTGDAGLPISLALCQTDPVTSVCINPLQPTPDPVVVDINSGDSPTFAVFANSAEPIALNPANSRVFLRFRDQQLEVRGATSVAVENRQ